MVRRGRSRGGGSTRGARGFLLADAIVATVILAGALAVVLALAGRALAAQRQGERLQTVAMLLDEHLNLVLARGPDNYASRFPVEGACDEPLSQYRFRLAITEGAAGEAYTVTATILWTESGRERSESITTRMSPRLGEEPDPERSPATPVLRP